MAHSCYQDLPKIPTGLSIKLDPHTGQANPTGAASGTACPQLLPGLQACLAGPSHPSSHSSKAISSQRALCPPHCPLGILCHTHPFLTLSQVLLTCPSLSPPGSSACEAGIFPVSLAVHPQHPCRAWHTGHTWHVSQCSLPSSELQAAELILEPRTNSNPCKLHGAMLFGLECLLSGTVLWDLRGPLFA